jgi:hypothetical protein
MNDDEAQTLFFINVLVFNIYKLRIGAGCWDKKLKRKKKEFFGLLTKFGK